MERSCSEALLAALLRRRNRQPLRKMRKGCGVGTDKTAGSPSLSTLQRVAAVSV